MTVRRFDLLSFDAASLRDRLQTARLRDEHATPQGAARVSSRLSRIGVQTYTDSEGKPLREYRPPSEVFDPASLKTFETASLVVGHPATIDPTNWREHAVGFILNPHVDADRYVGADLVIQDAATLKKVDSGDLIELSAGYDCDLVMGAGVSPEGDRFDATQKNLRINHVGLLPPGYARGGPAVRLQLGDAICVPGVCSPGCPCDGCNTRDGEPNCASREEGIAAWSALIDAYRVPMDDLRGETDTRLVLRLADERRAAMRELITKHNVLDVALGDKGDFYIATRLRAARMSIEERAAYFRALLEEQN